MSAVRAVFGVPLYRQPTLLPEALESLLDQTRRDFALVLIDDGNDAEVAEIVRRYAALDPDRITYEANPSRLGLVGNWRRAFELALERHPEAEFFAWGSDHDVWHPRWLEVLMAQFDDDDGLVAAYPRVWRIDPEGRVVRLPWAFDTRRETLPGPRLTRAMRSMAAGDMVYALFRVDAMRRAGVFRPVVQPDRLLLCELAVQGRFAQAPEVLWYRRRFATKPTVARQRRTLFGERPPLYAAAPWVLQHAAAIALAVGLRGEAAPLVTRRRGAAVAVQYLQASAHLRLRRRARRAARRVVVGARRGLGRLLASR